MTSVTFIILTYNSAAHIVDCLKSIEHFYKKELHDKTIEVLIIDNNSEDKTIDKITTYYNVKSKVQDNKTVSMRDNTHLYISKINMGFSKGVNFAVHKALGDYIVLLNPDGVLLDNNVLEITSYIKTHKEVAVIGGKIMTPQGKAELSAGRFLSAFRVFLTIIGIESISHIRFSPSKIQEVDFVSGGYMIFQKEIFNSVGGFDENLFMYVEDMELCFRFYKKGYKTIFYPYSCLQHIGQGSSNRMYAIVQIYKGILYFHKKHSGNLSYFSVKLLLMVKAWILMTIGKLFQNTYLATTYEKAFAICR